MRVSRKTISAALFEAVKAGYSWNFADRRARVPDDVPAFQQPAVFLIKPQERGEQPNGWGANRWTLQYYILIAFRAAGTPEDTPAEDQLDDILDAIDKVITPVDGMPNTLNGLVTNVWISGPIEIDSPTLFEQCAIWVPVSVLVGGPAPR